MFISNSNKHESWIKCMRDQEQLTKRKNQEVIGTNESFETVTQRFREESKKQPKVLSISEGDIEKMGLEIDIQKCIDADDDNPDTQIRIKSLSDSKIVTLKPSHRYSIFNKLADIGYMVDDNMTKGDIADFINSKLKRCDFSYSHEKLGWGFYKGNKVIKLANILTENESIPSKYTGGLDLNKRGSWEDFVMGVKKLIIGSPRLELALVLGVCGLIIQELNESDTNIVFCYYGPSSTGKTQATKIPLTLFGDPNQLFMTFNSTENRMETQLAEYRILPAIMDDKLIGINGESEKRRSFTVINHIFRYAAGHVRGRSLDKQSFTKYFCPIVISSEESIIDMLNSGKPKGQYFRILEVPCERGELTKNKEHSKQLEKFIRNNYGFAGDKFAEWLLSEQMYGDKLKDKYFEWHRKIDNDLGDTEYSSRMANRIAVILLAGDLLNKCFDFGINLESIQKLLIDSVTIALGKANKTISYIEQIKAYLDRYRKYFANCRNNSNPHEHMGLYQKNQYGLYELSVRPKALEYILSGKHPKDYLFYTQQDSKGDKFDTQQIVTPMITIELLPMLREWKKKGILVSGRDSGKTHTLTSQKTLFKNEKQQNVYIIQI
jgi:hypothetical protein